MRQAVVPGGKIDVVTPAELRELLQSELRETPQRSIIASAGGITDGSGLLDNVVLYEVPAGMEFELGWLAVEAQGATVALPTARAAAGATLNRNGQPLDFIYEADPAAPGAFRLTVPFRRQYSTGGPTPRFINGSVLGFSILGWVGGVRFIVTVGGMLFARPQRDT